MDSLTILVIIAVAATVVVLFAGLTSMVSGGEYDRQHSVQLMFTRVGLQAIAIILLIVAALYAGNFA
jgi:hypothetical protein